MSVAEKDDKIRLARFLGVIGEKGMEQYKIKYLLNVVFHSLV